MPRIIGFAIGAALACLLVSIVHAGNDVMGEVQFKGKTKIEKTSGVWIDGGYVGYLKELKGSKKVLLLPGEHSISVRQDGYEDFNRRIQVRPGETQVVEVAMQKVAAAKYPAVTATVKITVNPSRAAVFLDGQFVGHIGEFEGVGRGLLVAPGTHKIRVALPGYQTFETEINPQAQQKVEVKTDLLKDSGPLSDPMLNQAPKEGNTPAPEVAPPPPPPPPQPN